MALATPAQRAWYVTNKEWVRERGRAYRAANDAQVKATKKRYRDAHPERIRRSRNKRIAVTLLRGARNKAKAQCVGFNLTIKDIVVPTHCPVFGIKLKIGRGCSSFCSPTLDRVNPKRGYVRGNVAVISQFANALKGKATPAQLRRIAEWIDEFQAAKAA